MKALFQDTSRGGEDPDARAGFLILNQSFVVIDPLITAEPRGVTCHTSLSFLALLSLSEIR